MKKVLITGAAGTVGLQVIRFLLSEGKYEITISSPSGKNQVTKVLTIDTTPPEVKITKSS